MSVSISRETDSSARRVEGKEDVERTVEEHMAGLEIRDILRVRRNVRVRQIGMARLP